MSCLCRGGAVGRKCCRDRGIGYSAVFPLDALLLFGLWRRTEDNLGWRLFQRKNLSEDIGNKSYEWSLASETHQLEKDYSKREQRQFIWMLFWYLCTKGIYLCVKWVFTVCTHPESGLQFDLAVCSRALQEEPLVQCHVRGVEETTQGQGQSAK